MRHGANISSATAQAHGQPRVHIKFNFVLAVNYRGNALRGQNEPFVYDVFFDKVALG